MALAIGPPPVVDQGWWSSSWPGDRCLIFYDDDDVYHERWMVWPMGGARWIVLTPDGDLYSEDLSGSRPDLGPMFSRPLPPDGTLPALSGRGCYRFVAPVEDPELKQHMRAGRALAINAGGAAEAAAPFFVRNAMRALVAIEVFFGGAFLPRRMRGKQGAVPRDAVAPPAAALPRVPVLPLAGVAPRGPRTPRAGGSWLVAVSVKNASGRLLYRMGEQLLPDEEDLLGVGKGVVVVDGGLEVFVEFVKDADVASYLEDRRSALEAPDTGDGFGVAAFRERAQSTPPAVVPVAEADEVRTLAVVYDDHGDRFRLWRDVVSSLQADHFEDWPVEGPRTALWLMKVFAKAGLSPTQWLDRFFASARWSDSDRSAHEMRCLAKYFEVGGSYDQLNIASLAVFEHMSRRWQLIMEAHSDNPVQPDYESADYFAGTRTEKMGVAPELKSYVARQMKDDAEVKKQLTKTRELRTTPFPKAKAEPAKK